MTTDTREATSLCTRCKEQEGILDLRSDAVCRSCFATFVASKTVKRLEVLQRETRGTKLLSRPQRYLLALSRGPSSTALLHILDENVRRQRVKSGRVKFELVVVFVDVDVEAKEPGQKTKRTSPDTAEPINGDIIPADTSSSPSSSTPEKGTDLFATHFPSLTIHTVPLSSILSSPAIDWSLLPPQNQSLAPPLRLADFFARLPSASARADVSRLLIRHALYAAARAHDCAVILLGYTTTSLAELTLSEAAKGRGFGIPWFVNDGAFPLPRAVTDATTTTTNLHPDQAGPDAEDGVAEVAGELAPTELADDRNNGNSNDSNDRNGNTSPAMPTTGNIHIYSPLREIFRKEVLTYLSIIPASASPSTTTSPSSLPSSATAPSLAAALFPSLSASHDAEERGSGGGSSGAVVSHRDLSLDDVVTRFFVDVEASYPSVVANVVRTTGKLNRLAPTALQSQQTANADGIAGRQCRLCGVGLDPLGDERWKGEIGEADAMIPNAGLDDGGTARGEKRSRLCYGCERSVRG